MRDLVVFRISFSAVNLRRSANWINMMLLRNDDDDDVGVSVWYEINQHA
jgi:hypothetical protein